MKGLAFFAALSIGALSVWGGRTHAATADTAAASVDPAIALVGAPVTFTSTNPCTVACSLTWRRPDLGIARFGGVIVGRGEQITLTFAEPGIYRLVLDLEETCVGTSRLVCDSTAAVSVEIVTTLPPETTTTTTTLPPETTTTTTTLPPETTTTTTTEPPDPATQSLVAPSDLSVTRVDGRNRLTWTNPESSATSLTLERCEDEGCTSFAPIAILTTSTTSFIESHRKDGGSGMTYRLAASDSTTTVYSNIEIAAADDSDD